MRQESLDLGLKPSQSLDNFYPGPNGAVLQMLVDWLSVIKGQAQVRPTPIYLWGEAGSGKTHLLKAVMNAAQASGLQAFFINARDLNSMTSLDFDPRWQLMVLDDLHGLDPAKESVIFNWFIHALLPKDGLYRAILVSGDRPATDLVVREDLRTRIAGGMVCGLKVMSEQERREVLIQQANLRGLSLRGEVLDFMLARFSRDLSSLVGWLDQLDRYALQTQRPVTIPLIKDMLEDI
jgi:DnaA-homolog protein